MNILRAACGVLIALLLAMPALAASDAEIPITCKLIDAQEAARLLGAPLGPPRFEGVFYCAGLCPSLNAAPRCSFALANPPGQVKALHVDLALRPFEPGDWAAMSYVIGKGKPTSDVRYIMWRGRRTVWDFDTEMNWAVYDVFVGPRRHLCADLRVILDGISDDAAALQAAQALAQHALIRLRTATLRELVAPQAQEPLAAQRQGLCVNKMGAV